MRGDTHVRFGGRARETDPGQPGHRARARPNRSDTPGSTSDHRWSARQARLLVPHTLPPLRHVVKRFGAASMDALTVRPARLAAA